MFKIIDSFLNNTWAFPIKNKHAQTITNEFSINLISSKRSPLKIESDREAEFYNSIRQNFLKFKSVHHYCIVTDTAPSIAERVIKSIRNLLKKFEKGNADWISELF